MRIRKFLLESESCSSWILIICSPLCLETFSSSWVTVEFHSNHLINSVRSINNQLQNQILLHYRDFNMEATQTRHGSLSRKIQLNTKENPRFGSNPPLTPHRYHQSAFFLLTSSTILLLPFLRFSLLAPFVFAFFISFSQKKAKFRPARHQPNNSRRTDRT